MFTLYAGTGLVMTWERLLPGDPAPERRTLPLGAEARRLAAAGDGDALARRLREELDLTERPDAVTAESGPWVLYFRGPARKLELRVDAAAESFELIERRAGLARWIRNLHQLHGARGGPLYLVWSVLLDLTAVSAILFALTGLWLWQKLQPDRTGAVLLALGTLYTLGSLAFLVWTR